jgi:hypothetical protein
MRAPLIAIVLSSVGGAVCAQPADLTSHGRGPFCVMRSRDQPVS